MGSNRYEIIGFMGCYWYYYTNIFKMVEAVQQSKIERKRMADKLLTPKRRNKSGAKTDCAAASPVQGNFCTHKTLSHICNLITHTKK